MIELRAILNVWFIIAFLIWAFILIFRIGKLWKIWLITWGIWLTLFLTDFLIRHTSLPSVALGKPLSPNLYGGITIQLYNWLPSILIGIIPFIILTKIYEHKHKKSDEIKRGN